MKAKDWFDGQVNHKAQYVGFARIPIPLCKLVFREFWPSNGCWHPDDKCKRNWKDVECIQCNAFEPQPQAAEKE